MIDIADGIFPLKDLPKRHNLRGRSGKLLHFSTVFRWAQRDLETLVVGGVRYTSDDAFQAFCNARTAAKTGRPVETASRQPAARQRAIDKAHRELATLGL